MRGVAINSMGYSTAGFQDRSLEAALQAIAHAGFDTVEVVGLETHLPELPQGGVLAGLTALIERLGLIDGTVHAPLMLNVLGAPDEVWREEKVQVFSAYLHFAGAIGSRGLVAHPVPNPSFVDDPNVPGLSHRIVAAVRRSLDELVPVAEATGVRLLLENLPYDCDFPLLTMEELRPLVDDYPAQLVGLVMDTGHAWTRKIDPASEIRAAGDRLFATHLQDVDFENPQDNHWPPGQGGLDWDSIHAALSDVGYRGTWMFEIGHGRNKETPDELACLTKAFADEWGRGKDEG